MGHQPNRHSHLDVNQERGKPYDFKATCYFCLAAYNTDKSDAKAPRNYCSLECEIQDEWLP